MNHTQTWNQVKFRPMGRFWHPFQVIPDKFIIGGARVLKGIRKNDWRMWNRLFLVDFLLDLKYGLIIGFVILYQELNILLLWERTINNPDKINLDALNNWHLCQTLNHLLLEPFVLIFMQILANLESQQHEILLFGANQLWKHRGHLLVLIQVVTALAEVYVVLRFKFFRFVDARDVFKH